MPSSITSENHLTICTVLAAALLTAWPGGAYGDIVNGELVWTDPGSPNGLPGWTTNTSQTNINPWNLGHSYATAGLSNTFGLGSVNGVAATCQAGVNGYYGFNTAWITTIATTSLSQTFAATAGQSLLFDCDVISAYSFTGPTTYNHAAGWVKASLTGGTYNESAYLLPSSGLGTFTFSPFTSDGSYTVTFQTHAEGDMQQGTGYNPYAYASANFQNVRLVPEPSAATLLIAGAVGLLGYTWMRRLRAPSKEA